MMNQESVVVLSPGSDVILMGGIHAKILAVLLEDQGRVSYKVLWVNGTAIMEQWLPAFAIQKQEVNEI